MYNVDRERILAESAELADSPSTRMKGLLGRDGLAAGEGLIIDPCNSIHTWFMKFTIDVAFLDAEGRIVRLLERLPPWRLTRIHFNARRVLELPAGVVASTGTQVGDRLSFNDSLS